MVNRMIRVLYLLADNLNHTVDEIANNDAKGSFGADV